MNTAPIIVMIVVAAGSLRRLGVERERWLRQDRNARIGAGVIGDTSVRGRANVAKETKSDGQTASCGNSNVNY